MSERFQLHLGDCIQGMRAMADKSVDHVIADPPYSEHVHTNARTLAGIATRGGGGDAGISACNAGRKMELGFEHLHGDQMVAAAAEYARLVRRWCLVFSDTESAHLWREALESAGLEYVRTAFWHKLAGAPQFTGDRPAVAVEAITICHPQGRKRWNGGGKQGIYAHAIVQSTSTEPRLHTTQKPLALMRALVQDFTDPDDLILDSHAGSGTTGLAALELGRRFIGFEMDPKHHATAIERLRNAQKQEQLFAKPMKQLSLTGAA